MKRDKAKSKKKSPVKLLIVLLPVIIFLIIACDNRMIIRHYTVTSDKIDTPVRFAVIADLHCCSYGKKQSQLISAVNENKPDAILFPGDIKDDILPDKSVKYLLNGISDAYPCYYITGNHEIVKGIEESKALFKSYDIEILEGDCVTVELNGQTIQICGTDDPLVSENIFSSQLKNASQQADSELFTVLLAHRPERIETYLDYDFDLIVSGHAHGGQWRIPYVLNGLYAPNQGLFPKYAGGLYEHEETIHIISRGLDKHNPVPRIFNRPELVIIDVVPE